MAARQAPPSLKFSKQEHWSGLPLPSRKKTLLVYYDVWGFPGSSDSKESACNVGYLGSIPGLGRFPREGHGNPLQCSCLENPRDGGAWWAAIYGVAHSRTQLKRLSSSSSRVFKGFHGSLDGKASAYNAGDPGSVPGLGRSLGEGNGNPL